MTTLLRFFSVLWSIFWRACVYGVPLLFLTIVALAVVLVAPFWAVAFFADGHCWQGGFIVAGWLAFVILACFVVRRIRYKPVDRYSDGAI